MRESGIKTEDKIPEIEKDFRSFFIQTKLRFNIPEKNSKFDWLKKFFFQINFKLS
jgi:hypothetical protein